MNTDTDRDAVARMMSATLNDLVPSSMGVRKHLAPSEAEALWVLVRPVVMRMQERAWEKGYSAGWADCGDDSTGDPSDTPNPYAAGSDQ